MRSALRWGRERRLQTWGSRVFDLRRDAVANDGMYPDWLWELRTLAGRGILTDMFHGAEACLETWERASGEPAGPRPASAYRYCVGGGGGAAGAALTSSGCVGLVLLRHWGLRWIGVTRAQGPPLERLERAALG